MQNYSDYETERRLATLENKISAQYNDAYKELVKTCNEYFKKFEERYQKEYAAYQNGEYTDAEFKAWVKAQIARGEHWERLRKNAALRITKANETAASYINDTTPSIWTLNYNYTAYQADKAMGISFDIYDENTVRRLIVEDPSLLPSISQKAIDRAKDTAWNRNQFTKDVTSGILQGKSPAQLAKTIKHTMGLNQVSAIRNARTAITSAQNGGRMDGYDKLASMGVQMQKEWMATLDGRTRDSHRDLDGERVPYDEPFSNGLMFPADPQGAGREVWNCRCTMRAIFPENNEPRKMTYYGRNAEEAYKKWEANRKEDRRRTDNTEPVMYTKGDPLLEATGDMKKVKPEEYSAIIKRLSDEGVAIINSNSANRIGYQLREDGKPGTMLWPDEISEGAILHEMYHFEQDKKRGFAGYVAAMGNPRDRYLEEKEAYGIEITIAEKIERKDIATRLRRNLREERQRIYHG